MKNKFWIASALTIIGYCSSTFASTQQALPNPTAQGISYEKASPPYTRKDFSALDKEEGSPVYLSGTFLYLAPSTGIFPKKGYNPAFRFEQGTRGKGWESRLSYTHYSITSSHPLSPYDDSTPIKKVNVDSNFTLHDFEAVFAIPFSLRGLTAQTFVGAEYARTARRSELTYKNTPLTEYGSFSKFNGYGPQVGFRLDKPIYKGISLYTVVSQSLLRSHMTWGDDKHKRFSPVTKARVGTDWCVEYEPQKFLHISAGYELQYWMNEVVNSSYIKSYERDFGLHGFNIQARLGF